MAGVVTTLLLLATGVPFASGRQAAAAQAAAAGTPIYLDSTYSPSERAADLDAAERLDEPWRSRAFPLIKDLAVDRRSLDRIIQSGGYISAPTGTAPEAHSTPVPKKDSDAAFDAATCIGCGACVAACPNGSAMLFTSAKVTHLGLMPQGQPERNDRVVNMVAQQDREGFGGCTNIGECSHACPKGISMETISRLNHDLLGALRAGARPKS